MIGAAKLQRVLQLIFRQQALDAARKITPGVIDRGQAPDMHHWIAATATAIRPIMLELFQNGLLHTAAKLGLQAEPTLGAAALAGPSSRRHQVGNEAAFGSPVKEVMSSGRWRQMRTEANSRSASNYPVAKAGSSERNRLNYGTVVTACRPYSFNKQVFKAAGLGATFDIFNPRVLDSVDAACMVLCRSTLETATTDLTTAIQRLRETLKQGAERGEALQSLAQEIQTIFNDKSRAQLIAVTESARMQNGGRLLAAADSGRVSEKEWVASANSCEQCRDLDGKRVKLSEPFVVIGSGAYSVVMYPPLHPRCDCTWDEIFGETIAA